MQGKLTADRASFIPGEAQLPLQTGACKPLRHQTPAVARTSSQLASVEGGDGNKLAERRSKFAPTPTPVPTPTRGEVVGTEGQLHVVSRGVCLCFSVPRSHEPSTL